MTRLCLGVLPNFCLTLDTFHVLEHYAYDLPARSVLVIICLRGEFYSTSYVSVPFEGMRHTCSSAVFPRSSVWPLAHGTLSVVSKCVTIKIAPVENTIRYMRADRRLVLINIHR
ncbi:uncharacterized protein LOC143178251 [Calliopsis andreniformis]|uniref:uncharacterized protein LOC143178251 n=1 Tax=Calliopsis andreniformis TaxID=337506 RepID=UPI003FCC311D